MGVVWFVDVSVFVVGMCLVVMSLSGGVLLVVLGVVVMDVVV